MAISELGVSPHTPVEMKKREVLAQPYVVAKPVIGNDGANAQDNPASSDPALAMAIKRAASEPHYTALNRN